MLFVILFAINRNFCMELKNHNLYNSNHQIISGRIWKDMTRPAKRRQDQKPQHNPTQHNLIQHKTKQQNTTKHNKRYSLLNLPLGNLSQHQNIFIEPKYQWYK